MTAQNEPPRQRNAGGDAESELLSKPNDDSLARTPGKAFNPYLAFEQNALVPLPLLRIEKLPYGAMLLYGLLRKFAGRDGRAVPSVDTLASEMGTSPRNVRKLIGKLEEHALIRRVRNAGIRPSDGRGTATNRYEFLWHEAFESASTGTIVPSEEEADEHVQPEQSGTFNRNNRVRSTGTIVPPKRFKKKVQEEDSPLSCESNNNSNSSQAHARKPRVKREHKKLMDSRLAQSTLEALRKIERFRGTTIRKSDGTPAAWVHELEPLADRLECEVAAGNVAVWVAELDCPSNETPVLAVRNAVREEIDFQQRFVEREPELRERIKRAAQDGDRQGLVTLAQSEFPSIKTAAIEALEVLETERLEREKREKRQRAAAT